MILSLARVWQSLPGLGIMKSALNNMTGATSVVGSQYVCDHNFSIEILSIDPLIIYLNNFLKDEEINHLLQHRYEAQSPLQPCTCN